MNVNHLACLIILLVGQSSLLMFTWLHCLVLPSKTSHSAVTASCFFWNTASDSSLGRTLTHHYLTWPSGMTGAPHHRLIWVTRLNQWGKAENKRTWWKIQRWQRAQVTEKKNRLGESRQLLQALSPRQGKGCTGWTYCPHNVSRAKLHHQCIKLCPCF